MTNYFLRTLIALALLEVSRALAQSPLPSAAKASEVDELRQEVRSLTETVKALQQQVKEQQNVLEKANIAGNQLPQNAETPSASVPA